MQLVIGARDGGASRALDQLKEILATLLAQHVAHERAERSDVVPERDVFRCELGQEASAGVNSRAVAIPHAATSIGAFPSLPTGSGSPFCSTRLVRRAALN